MKRLLVPSLALVLVLASSTPLAAQDTSPPRIRQAIRQIDALMAAEYDKYLLGGMTVAVIQGPRLIWAKGYGYADMERRIPAGRDTVYRIGSITKMFTALMLLQLADQGKVGLSDPVEKYFPEVNQIKGRFINAPPITLVQLATHTSGLATEPDDLPKYLKGPVADWERVLIQALPQTHYVAEPGTRYNYSNIGYAILGAALGRAAARPYTDYVQKQIFEPLGMTHSALEPDNRIKPKLAKGYSVENALIDTGTPEREHEGRGYKVPNGAIYSTVEDLARFASFELGEGPAGVLSQETLTANFERGAHMDAQLSSGYGLGFQVFRRGDLVMFGHGGAVAGYLSGILFDRRTKTGIILLRNVSGEGGFDVGGLCMKALEIISRASRGERRKLSHRRRAESSNHSARPVRAFGV